MANILRSPTKGTWFASSQAHFLFRHFRYVLVQHPLMSLPAWLQCVIWQLFIMKRNIYRRSRWGPKPRPAYFASDQASEGHDFVMIPSYSHIPLGPITRLRICESREARVAPPMPTLRSLAPSAGRSGTTRPHRRAAPRDESPLHSLHIVSWWSARSWTELLWSRWSKILLILY